MLEKPAVEEIPKAPEIPDDKAPKHTAKVEHLSRGKRLVELSKKRKMKDEDEEASSKRGKTPRKVPKQQREKIIPS